MDMDDDAPWFRELFDELRDAESNHVFTAVLEP